MYKEILNKANIVTFLGLIFAVIGIVYCFTCNTTGAIICATVACICDGLDGSIAKKLRKNNDYGFGIELDSLVDIISSGILPISICISMGFNNLIDIIIYCVFMLSGVVRLAYYNIHSYNSEIFIGIPITVSNIVIVLLYFLFKNEIIFMVSLFILAILFILPLKIKKINLKLRIIISIIGLTLVIILGAIKHG